MKGTRLSPMKLCCISIGLRAEHLVSLWDRVIGVDLQDYYFELVGFRTPSVPVISFSFLTELSIKGRVGPFT